MLKIRHSFIASKKIHAAVIVETRAIFNLPNIILRHMAMLGSEWRLYIFHGKDNRHLFNNLDARKINLQHNLNRHSYSGLLSTHWFWMQIPHEKILVFQQDSMLLRRGIEQFMEWDWVGAPSWWGGYNGGLSLRSRSKILKVIQECHYTGESEDMYFHRNIGRVGGRIAPPHVADQFACEAYFRLGTLGCHGIHNFHGQSKRRLINTQYLRNNIKV